MTADRATVAALAEGELHLPQWWSGNGVSELLTPAAGVVPVLGAGVGRGAGLPDAEQLAEWLVDNAPLIETPSDRPGLFQVVDAVDPTRMSADELRGMVAGHID